MQDNSFIVALELSHLTTDTRCVSSKTNITHYNYWCRLHWMDTVYRCLCLKSVKWRVCCLNSLFAHFCRDLRRILASGVSGWFIFNAILERDGKHVYVLRIFPANCFVNEAQSNGEFAKYFCWQMKQSAVEDLTAAVTNGQ